MNSLRTDDIIGAVPRIRHMPKNLYRPKAYSNNQSMQGYNQQYSGVRNVSKMMDYDVNYNGGKWQQSYNQNMYGNFPLSQYDPNPFIKPNPKNSIINTQRSRYNKGNDFNNRRSMSELNNYYDSPQMHTNDRYIMMREQNKNINNERRMSLEYQNNQSDRYKNDSVDKRQSRQKYINNMNEIQQNKKYNKILPKQALVINYDQLKSINLPQIGNKNSLPKQQNPQRNSSSPISNNRQQNSRVINKGESENSKRQKSIFRGIGFNIITNSKYQYNLQTSNPYSSRSKQ